VRKDFGRSQRSENLSGRAASDHAGGAAGSSIARKASQAVGEVISSEYSMLSAVARFMWRNRSFAASRSDPIAGAKTARFTCQT
jgi:hypothetical protein